MNADGFSISALRAMAHSPVRNYVVPGLTSWLIGSPGPSGTVRLFESEREHQENVIPHSHRFDFQCWVLKGEVVNRIWYETASVADGDLYERSTLTYQGTIGAYKRERQDAKRYAYVDHRHNSGECYGMTSEQIHSIQFSRGALVLFFEGPQVTRTSSILEPICDAALVPTFEVKPWMFLRTDDE